MFTKVLNGVKTAVRNWRVVLLIWAWYGALAAVVVLPAATWWRGALNHAVDATTLLGGFNFAVLADLTKYDYVGAFGLLTGTAAAAMMLSLVSSSFIMGGMIATISGADASHGVMHRFFGGAGYFFGRFLRLLLIGGTGACVAGALLALTLAAVESPFSSNLSETGTYGLLVFNLAVLAIGCGLFLLALDYARIQVAIDDSRGVFRVYVRAVGFVVRHAVTTYGMAFTVIVAAAALMLGCLAYESVSPVASTWKLIAVLAAIHQGILVTRVGLRVSLVSAEFEYAERMVGGRHSNDPNRSV